jgi:hypothetical protein
MEAKTNRLMGNVIVGVGIAIATILYIFLGFTVALCYYNAVGAVGLVWAIVIGLIMASPVGISIWGFKRGYLV